MTTRTVTWQTASDGRVPNGALPVGRTGNGETLYTGRVYHDDALTLGKVPILTCLEHKSNVARRTNVSASSCVLCDVKC